MPDHFSAWAVIWGNVAALIGGGGNMVSAMVYTLLSDAIPVDIRTSVFYGIYAMALILKVVVVPISAVLMGLNPWLALWLGYGILIVGMFSALLIPETLTLRRTADSKRRGSISGHGPLQDDHGVAVASLVKKHTWAQNILFSLKNNTSHVVHFVFAAKSIVLLLFAYSISFLNRLNFRLNLLQFLTKRFHWDWPTVSSAVIRLQSMLTYKGDVHLYRKGPGCRFHPPFNTSSLFGCSC